MIFFMGGYFTENELQNLVIYLGVWYMQFEDAGIGSLYYELKDIHGNALFTLMNAGKEMCVWCANPESDYEPVYPEKELCRSHLAEYEGLSVAELDRMEREQEYDLQ